MSNKSLELIENCEVYIEYSLWQRTYKMEKIAFRLKSIESLYGNFISMQDYMLMGVAYFTKNVD
jgi:hypothetical protein